MNIPLFCWHSYFFCFVLLKKKKRKKKHISHISEDTNNMSVHSGMQAASRVVDMFCLLRIMGMML